MTEHALGYLPDHPLEVASRTNPARWPMDLLMEGIPLQAAPDHYLAPGLPDVGLDQDGIGACVAFAGETIQNANEAVDEGVNLFDTASAFTAYDWLKHGHGTYPGDGIASEGSYPEALWKLAKTEGLPDRLGRVHRISAYYSANFASRDDFLYLQQVILAFGPVNFGIPWPNNWFAEPAGPFYQMVAPGGASSGHSITVAGWDIETGGNLPGDWLVCVQTWGEWGGPKSIYRIRADWLYQVPMGPQVFWKTVDIKDAPAPIGGDMVPSKDNIPRLLLVPVGTQCYSPTASTPLVRIGGTNPARVYSPCAATDTQYLARISTGGVTQLVRVNKADVTVIASSPIS